MVQIFKCIFVAVGISVAAFSGPLVITDPIPLTGSGGWTFVSDTGDAYCGGSFIASGTNGRDSVAFSEYVEGYGPLWYANGPSSLSSQSILSNGVFRPYYITIDGISSIYGQFSIGGGGGFLEITDSLGNLLASAPLIGYVEAYEETYIDGCAGATGFCIPSAYATGILAITTTPVTLPESSSVGLVGAGVVALGFWGRRCKSLKAQTRLT